MSKTIGLILVAGFALATTACDMTGELLSKAGFGDQPVEIVDGVHVDPVPPDNVVVDPMPVEEAPPPDPDFPPIEAEGDLPGEGIVVGGGGELLGAEGNTVEIAFSMGIEECYGVERVDVAETGNQVDVDIYVAARDLEQACVDLAVGRSLIVELEAPLGDRALLLGGTPVGG